MSKMLATVSRTLSVDMSGRISVQPGPMPQAAKVCPKSDSVL